jgi:hypothetical protein
VGGLLCWARRSAILRFDVVPTNPDQLKEFDTQMRQLIAAPGVTESLLSDKSSAMQQLCTVLAKPAWTTTDRVWLIDLVESLYE